MFYRTDKFNVGDRVVWHPDYVRFWNKEKAGEGPFVITKFWDRENSRDDYDFGYEQSLWESMGHTQHVMIDGDPREDHMYSGAFFIKVPETAQSYKRSDDDYYDSTDYDNEDDEFDRMTEEELLAGLDDLITPPTNVSQYQRGD